MQPCSEVGVVELGQCSTEISSFHIAFLYRQASEIHDVYDCKLDFLCGKFDMAYSDSFLQ